MPQWAGILPAADRKLLRTWPEVLSAVEWSDSAVEWKNYRSRLAIMLS